MGALITVSKWWLRRLSMRRSRLALVAIFISLPVGSLLAAEPSGRSVDKLRYGVALYEYFQQDYLAALSEMQVAQARGALTTEDATPLVLQGAMSLAFGLERDASRIFEQALDNSSNASVRNAAWFYLARMQYRRSDWSAARASLAKVSGDMDDSLQQELQAMRVNLAIMTVDLPQAELALQEIGKRNSWQPYLYYNLGTAHIRAARTGVGINYLDRLADQKLNSAEHLALQDKGLTAAGYSFMQSQDYRSAVERFSQVRLSSPFVEQALLGYGWSAAELGDYRMALGPWRILAARSVLRSEVQEALLAVPYAEEKLGYLANALEAFEAAEKIFTDELVRLEQLKSKIHPESLIASLSTDSRDHHDNSMVNPQWLGLVELLSSDQFEAFSREFADLDRLSENLANWRHDIAIYRTMLEQRKWRRVTQLQQLAASNYPTRLADLRRQRDVLQQMHASATDADLVSHYADSALQSQWSRTVKANNALQRLRAAGQNYPLQAAQLARYQGLLQWRISEQAVGWRWTIRKQLDQLHGELATLEDTLLRLQRVVDEMPDITPFLRRLESLELRTRAQQLAVDSRFETVQLAFEQAVIEQLEQQQLRLGNYLVQAQLSKARLYDQARLEAQL